jgi:tryptophan-rich sensory protein
VLVAAVLLIAVAAVAFGGSFATAGNVDGWYADADKAPWNPPSAVFGPVWSVLYFGIAAACFLVWRRGFRGAGEPNAARPWIAGWIVQLALNAAWTPLFFGGFPVLGEPAWWIAAVVILLLLATVLWLAARAWRFSRIATGIMVAYAVWLAFATTLNIAIIALN